uniref:DUF3402 domain-containing protein n=1 Tax=Anisakis simplex TaxID=6269 RepID=A0A0M3KIE9_ANISI
LRRTQQLCKAESEEDLTRLTDRIIDINITEWAGSEKTSASGEKKADDSGQSSGNIGIDDELASAFAEVRTTFRGRRWMGDMELGTGRASHGQPDTSP